MPASIAGTTITVKGIVLNVVADGYRKGISQSGGPWRDVIYQCDGSDSDNACDALKGVGKYFGVAGTAGRIGFPDPHRYPLNENIRCQEVSCEFKGPAMPSPGLYTSDLAHISAHYATPEFDIAGTDVNNTFDGISYPWSRQSTRGFLEQLTVPKTLLLKDDGSSVDVSYQLDVPVLELLHVRSQVPYLNFALLRGLLNGVNASTFLGCARGTLLYLNFDQQPVPGYDGSIVQEISLTFKFRPFEWNMVPNGLDGWVLVQSASFTGVRAHPYVDFLPLLTYGT